MTKRAAALIVGDTFTHCGMRYTVIGDVCNTGEKTTVFTNVMALHIPNFVTLKMV